MNEETVTLWIGRLMEGDEEAARAIWQRYWPDLLRLARRKLGAHAGRAVDEEDLALSAFKSFCRGMAAGRFREVDDRDDLWRLLATITSRKIAAEARRQFAQKRGGGTPPVGDSGVGGENSSGQWAGLDGLPGGEPPPDLAVMMTEQCEKLLDCLDDPSLQKIVLLKLEGYTNEEIARELDCAVVTIERKLARIRKRWEAEVE